MGNLKSILIGIVPFSILILWFYWGFAGIGGLFWDEEPESIPVVKEVKAPPSSFMVGGVQMNEGDQINWIKTMLESGMNTVEVTVYAHQGRWDENNLWFSDDDPGTIDEIRLAKAAGMNVVLVLRLQLDHAFRENRFLWHGMVFPQTEYLLNRWFEEYLRFARKWAVISEKEGVDVLVIGSEMNQMFGSRLVEDLPQLEEYYLNDAKQKEYHQGMMKYEDSIGKDLLYTEGMPNYDDLNTYLKDKLESKRAWAKKTSFADSTDNIQAINVRRTILNYYWERVIYGLRGVYHGKLTIAANFDNYQEVNFWEKLDYIGINAYFPLRKLSDKGSLAEVLKKNWDKVLDDILAFRIKNDIPDHPILFTELGYANHSGGTYAPWQGQGFSLILEKPRDSLFLWKNQPRNFYERNQAVRALYQSVKERNFPLGGILYWKFTSKKEQLQYDPFALHIGKTSKDTLPGLLTRFKTLEAEIAREELMEKIRTAPESSAN